MPRPTLESARAQLKVWQSASAELARLEAALSQAMTEYADTLGDPPRQLIIDVERKRTQVAELFDMALAALDACSPSRTGMTHFGGLS
jgi:hypothetical protein